MKTDKTDFICFLSSAYLGPVSYYSQIAHHRKTVIEQHDNYIKQTYRNRCRIASADKITDLIVPIRKDGIKCLMKDIRISYTENWQKTHWKAIESAYNSSPFFDYYKDDFEHFYREKYPCLLDFNNELQALVLRLTDIQPTIEFTSEYRRSFAENEVDLRDFFHPKKETEISFKPYYQVFDNRFGFRKELSIIDLLFNMGPESVFYL